MTTGINTDTKERMRLIQQALPEPTVLLGVDLGQNLDPTAVVTLERYYVPTSDLYYHDDSDLDLARSWFDVDLRYKVDHIDRWIHVPYTIQVKRLMRLMKSIGGDLWLLVDGTWVGRGVADMIREELAEREQKDREWIERIESVQPGFIQITGGGSVTKSPGFLNVPKKDLVTAALTLFQDGRLDIAEDLELCATLEKELNDFKMKINIATGHTTFEAWREKDHDDLVLALALACWAAETYMYKYDRIEVPGFVTTAGPSPITPPYVGLRDGATRQREAYTQGEIHHIAGRSKPSRKRRPFL
jgi:hypothetical protein